MNCMNLVRFELVGLPRFGSVYPMPMVYMAMGRQTVPHAGHPNHFKSENPAGGVDVSPVYN